MKLNHLAICARDVAASQDFYCTYFGFRQGPGLGLLSSGEGFALAIHEVHDLGDLLFFCRDPAGFLVEVRGVGAPDAAPAP